MFELIKMLKMEKPEKAEALGRLIEEYPVIALLSMHKLPGRQLQSIRESLRSKAIIKMSKKSLLERAIKTSKKKNIQTLLDYVKDEPALLLSKENLFRLFRLIKGSRSPASAKANDIAPKDIVVQKGATNLPPGPAISTLQKVGLKTTVQAGKIAISQDKVVVKAGEKIGEDAVGVLSLLKMEPMEIGLEVVIACEDGVFYEKNVLDIDVEKYVAELQKCVSEGVNLSINANYPTGFTIELMLQKAFSEAKSLCMGANFPEGEFMGSVLAKAAREAKALEGYLGG